MNAKRLEALELSKGLNVSPTALAKVAAATSEESARWAFTQWELRTRARSKFERADEMLFDREGLEMASHERVAQYHASRIPPHVRVHDLTAGIGADTIALAARGPVTAYELSEERVELLRWNLHVHGGDAEIVLGDSLGASGLEYAFADPARRNAGVRTLNLDEFSPKPATLAEIGGSCKLMGIKLSPVIPDHLLTELGGELEFVSFGRECREAIVWLGEQSFFGKRSAVHVESGERIVVGGEPTTPSTPDPKEFLFEADPSAIRAHALPHLCKAHKLLPLGDSNGYLTGREAITSPWLSGFQVLASHSADLKRTRQELKRLGGGTPIVKSRAKVDVESLRRALRADGEELILLVYTVGKSLRHVIARRL